MSQGERELQEKFSTKRRADAFYNNQMIDYLNEHMIQFIKRMQFLFISTSDKTGHCDSSFKAGDPGFVYVIDEKTLMYPEYRGNGVMASLGNIVENPHAGLLFIDFLQDQVGLHVNGRAKILENDQLKNLIKQTEIDKLAQFHQKRAERWVVIEVDEAYIHCSKHIPHLVDQKFSQDRVVDEPSKNTGDYFKVKSSHD